MANIFQPSDKIKKLLPPQEVREGVEYCPSQFALPFTHKGKGYVFHTLTKQCVEAALPASCSAGSGYDELIRGYFLVPRGKDEDTFYVKTLSLINTFFDEKRNNYMIFPTLACNARCIYCFEQGMVPVSMTEESAEQTVRYILETRKPGKKVHLDWFGGEPLLGEKYIDLICRRLDEAGTEYYSTMTSNGSLITPAIIEKMKGPWRLTHISISMEGPEEDYRRRKNYVAYHGEYHKVIESISLLRDAGIGVTVRCNVDLENLPGIPAFLEEMGRSVRNKDGVCLYLALLNDERLGNSDLEAWEKVLSMDPLIEKAGFVLNSWRKSGMHLRTGHCLADNGYPIIAPDGKLYACEDCLPESLYGDIWNGTTDVAAEKEFRRMDLVREKCRGCAFLPMCTPFSHCPEEDTHCKDVERMFLLYVLRRSLDLREDKDKEKNEKENVMQGEQP